MIHALSLEEHFQAQTEERKRDPGTTMGIPVAFLLNPKEGVDFEFFVRGMNAIGGVVSNFSEHPTDTAVKISYEDRSTELWVHSREEEYLDIYNEFCQSELKIKLIGSFKNEGFAVDHSYNKASIPPDVDAYIRLFLVRAGPNSSWGAYYEQRLKDLFLSSGRVGLRHETVAIRAKLTGIKAPLKGSKKARNLENVAAVVRQLQKFELTDVAQFSTDFNTLAAFCGMADGEYVGMTVSIDSNADTNVVPHEKKQ